MVEKHLQGQAMMLRGVVALLTVAICGCQFAPKPAGLLEREGVEPKITSHQLRVMVNEYVLHFKDRIELTADEILADVDTPEIRRNALLLKINAISEAFHAGTRQDPLGAHLDLWILNRQLAAMIESQLGHQLFGASQGRVSDECQRLELRLRNIQENLGADIRFGEDFVAQFASDYPLTSLYFDREPIASRYIEEVQTPGKELMHVVANLDENVDELRKLTVLYAEHLPKQVRWEAELLALEAQGWPVVRKTLQDLADTTEAASELASVAEHLPALVQQERIALISVIEAERKAAFRQIDNMRLDTLNAFRSERDVVLKAVTRERYELSKLADSQRQAVTNDIEAQVTKAIKNLDAISEQRVQQAVTAGPIIVDIFFNRMRQLLLLIFAVAIAVALFLLFCRRLSKTKDHGKLDENISRTIPFRSREKSLQNDAA